MTTSREGPKIRKAGRRQQSKQRLSRGLVKTQRSMDWKLVDSVFPSLHEYFRFTLNGGDDDGRFDVHADFTALPATEFYR
jgi:hypothetical protein